MRRLTFYLNVCKYGFKARLIYRKSTLLRLLHAVIVIMVTAFVWIALLKNGARLGTTLEQMITYVIVTRMVEILLHFTIGDKISQRMRLGTIESDLSRPYNLKAFLFFDDIGNNCFDALIITLPVCVMLIAGYGFVLPESPAHLFLFLITLLNGGFILFFYRSIMGSFGFWLLRNPFLGWHYQNIETLFSGTVVPIWFYPAWLVPITYAMPFRYITYEPMTIFLGKVPLSHVWQILLMQLLWLAILGTIDRVIWSRAYRKLVVQGG